MTLCLGEVPAGTTLYIPFATYGGANGESITLTGLAVTDIEIYKNGSVTQRASDAGYALLDTDGIDFDGITGIHGFSIDLSDNTDSGFYAVGSQYWVVISAVTVDTQTVNFIAAMFRIGPAETVAGYKPVDAAAISGDTTAANNLETAFDDTAGPVPWLGIVDQGTAQSATGTTVVLRAAAAFADDTLIGCTIFVFGSTQGYWQSREITDNTLADDTVTVDTWTTTPTGTITYKIFAGSPALATLPAVNVTQAAGTAWGSGAITAGSVSAAAANKIADHCRRRTQANVEASSDGDAVSIGSEYGLIQQNQESNLVDNAGFLTVYKTDGTTELAQKAVTTDAAAEAITGIE